MVTRCDITDALLQASQYTYSDVLTKLFLREELPQSLAEKDFSSGFVCICCKYLVEELYRLQYQLRGLKNQIVSLFKKSQFIEAEDASETKDDKDSEDAYQMEADKAEVIEEQQEDEYKTPVKNTPKDDAQIIESLKRKRGNKFLIKWENSPENENTWQPRSSIPDFIVKVSKLNEKPGLFPIVFSFGQNPTITK